MTIDVAEKFIQLVMTDFSLKICMAEIARGQRGVILVQCTEKTPLFTYMDVYHLLKFINANHFLISTIPPTPQNANLLQALYSYDPQTQIVLAVYRHTKETMENSTTTTSSSSTDAKNKEMKIDVVSII